MTLYLKASKILEPDHQNPNAEKIPNIENECNEQEKKKMTSCETDSITSAEEDRVINALSQPDFTRNFFYRVRVCVHDCRNLPDLYDPDTIIFEDLKFKIEEALSLTNESILELEQLTYLKKQMAKVNLKVINVRFI